MYWQDYSRPCSLIRKALEVGKRGRERINRKGSKKEEGKRDMRMNVNKEKVNLEKEEKGEREKDREGDEEEEDG